VGNIVSLKLQLDDIPDINKVEPTPFLKPRELKKCGSV
jgi:hypothetical protein